jgi:hypothetical protein
MTGSGFYLESTDFEKRFKELVRSVSEKVAAEGLFSAGQALMTAADDEIPQVPYKTGDLRAARVVKDPEISAGRVSVDCGYNSKYAAYQHEGQRKDGSHKVKEYTTTQVPGPGPKFLEKKMAGNAKRFMAIVADRIREKLGGSPR